MPFPIDPTRLLAYAGTNQPLRISRVPFDTLRARLAVDGLHEGDEIICQHDGSGRTLVTTANGRHLIVDLAYAALIEVAPATTTHPRHHWHAVRRKHSHATL